MEQNKMTPTPWTDRFKIVHSGDSGDREALSAAIATLEKAKL